MLGQGSELRCQNRKTRPEGQECPAAQAKKLLAVEAHGVGSGTRKGHKGKIAPTNPLVMFAFTDFSDPRWTLLRKYLALRQDTRHPSPMKAGLFNESTWGAYFLNGHLFLKQYSADPAARYPDMGCSFEIFANGVTLELETLGPQKTLAPGGSLEHGERWTLHRGVVLPEKLTDDALDQVIAPLL